MHALPDIENRLLRRQQQVHRAFDILGVRAVAGHHRGLVIERFGHILLPDIERDFHHHRPAPAIAQLGKGAAHDGQHLGAAGNGLHRLDERAQRNQRTEVGRHLRRLAQVAHRQHQERHRLAVGLGNGAHAIFDAGAVLGRIDAYRLAAGDARDGVGHVAAHPLGARNDRPDAQRRAVVKNVVERVAADGGDVLALEDLGNGFANFHDCLLFCTNEMKWCTQQLVCY
ncbi:MAG: hypothetical protein JWP96_208 [Polaromonas sp.]|nr:hypothetical protein [Polaromonas sp.]